MEELCRKLEHFETPYWAIKSILKKEILTTEVIDPCCGTGVLSEAAKTEGYEVNSYDIHNWGYSYTKEADFLKFKPVFKLYEPFTILMNPPFSMAVEFVKKSMEIKAHKIVCFQRLAWYESQKRREFWDKYPPSRMYICGNRATCWRHDIPKEKRNSSTPTAHAWFVWEKGHKGTQLDRIYKENY